MHPSYKRAALVLLLLLGTFTYAHAQDDIAARVLARINQARAEAGLAPLARNGQLDAAAQAHANDLQSGAASGHRGANGSTMQQRIANAGYIASAVGENWGAYRTLDQIMDFWLSDPPHRRNILSAKFRDIGIGVAARPNGGLIIITDFGAPANAAESALAVQPTAVPKKARATATRAKPAAPKPTRTPTRTPTRKPANKPTRIRVAQAVAPTPMPEPTRAANASQTQDAPMKFLRARGRIGRTGLHGAGQVSLGRTEVQSDLGRMITGAALTFGGLVLLGVAYVGHRRHRAASGLG